MLLEVFLAKQPSLISCMVGRMVAAYQPLPPGGWGCHQPLACLCCGGARACLAAALLGAEATGRARLDGLLSYHRPLGQWRKGGDRPHTGGDFFPQEMNERSKCHPRGTSLVVQWLRRHASNTGNAGLIPGQRTKIPHAVCCSQRK